MRESVFLFLVCSFANAYASEVDLLSNASLYGPDDLSHYVSDSCKTEIWSRLDPVAHPEQPIQGSAWRCQDQTVSFLQPASVDRFFKDYEGRCGQTAIANLLYSYCGQIVDPQADISKKVWDFTPGIRVSTVVDGINEFFKSFGRDCPRGYWTSIRGASDPQHFIRALQTGLSQGAIVERLLPSGEHLFRSPVAVLLNASRRGTYTLHWVTVVDVERGDDFDTSCHVVLNQWAAQYRVPCGLFSKWAKNVAPHFSDEPLPISYVRVRFIPTSRRHSK